MKIKNLAFFGVMAAILGVGNAAHADTATVIASQAYVDARDALKQNILNVNNTTGNIRTSGNGNVITGVSSTTDANGQGIVTFETGNIDVSGDISTAIGGLDGNISGSTGVVKTISQTDGIVTATRNTVDTADITNDAVTNAKLADNAVQTENIKDGNVTMPKTNFIVVQGNSEAAWNTADPESQNASEKALATANAQGDKYVPTVAAVEKRIDAATSNSLDALDYTSSGTGVVKTVTQSNGQLGATVSTVDTAEITNNAVTADKLASDSVTTAKIVDLNVTTEKLAANAVTTAKITDLNVTTDKLAANAVTNAKLAADAVKTGNIENGTIKSEDVGEKETNNIITSSNRGYLATVDGVQKGIMYQSASQTSWNKADSEGSHFDREADTTTQNNQKTAEKSMATQFTKADEYVPTVAAVERRVQEAEANATSGITSATDNTASASTAQDATTLTIVAAGNDGNQTTKLATSHAVAEGFTAVNTAIGNMALSGATTTNTAADDAITAVSQTNGKLSASKGKLTAAALDSTAKSTSIPSSGAVDTKLATEKAVADALSSSSRQSDWTQTTTTAPDYIKNKPTLGALAAKDKIGNSDVTTNSLAYTDVMNYQLSNVNAHGDTATAYARCTDESPCTLTMVWNGTKPKYEWTNMDTEGERADIAADS